MPIVLAKDLHPNLLPVENILNFLTKSPETLRKYNQKKRNQFFEFMRVIPHSERLSLLAMTNREGETLLMRLATLSDFEAMESALLGFTPEQRLKILLPTTKQGASVLSALISPQDKEERIIERLRTLLDPFQTEQKKQLLPPAFWVAVQQGWVGCVTFLLEGLEGIDKFALLSEVRATSRGRTALMSAAEKGFKRLIPLFFESLSDEQKEELVKQQDPYEGNTALVLAALQGHWDFVEALWSLFNPPTRLMLSEIGNQRGQNVVSVAIAADRKLTRALFLKLHEMQARLPPALYERFGVPLPPMALVQRAQNQDVHAEGVQLFVSLAVMKMIEKFGQMNETTRTQYWKEMTDWAHTLDPAILEQRFAKEAFFQDIVGKNYRDRDEYTGVGSGVTLREWMPYVWKILKMRLPETYGALLTETLRQIRRAHNLNEDGSDNVAAPSSVSCLPGRFNRLTRLLMYTGLITLFTTTKAGIQVLGYRLVAQHLKALWPTLSVEQKRYVLNNKKMPEDIVKRIRPAILEALNHEVGMTLKEINQEWNKGLPPEDRSTITVADLRKVNFNIEQVARQQGCAVESPLLRISIFEEDEWFNRFCAGLFSETIQDNALLLSLSQEGTQSAVLARFEKTVAEINPMIVSPTERRFDLAISKAYHKGNRDFVSPVAEEIKQFHYQMQEQGFISSREVSLQNTQRFFLSNNQFSRSKRDAQRLESLKSYFRGVKIMITGTRKLLAPIAGQLSSERSERSATRANEIKRQRNLLADAAEAIQNNQMDWFRLVLGVGAAEKVETYDLVCAYSEIEAQEAAQKALLGLAKQSLETLLMSPLYTGFDIFQQQDTALPDFLSRVNALLSVIQADTKTLPNWETLQKESAPLRNFMKDKGKGRSVLPVAKKEQWLRDETVKLEAKKTEVARQHLTHIHSQSQLKPVDVLRYARAAAEFAAGEERLKASTQAATPAELIKKVFEMCVTLQRKWAVSKQEKERQEEQIEAVKREAKGRYQVLLAELREKALQNQALNAVPERLCGPFQRAYWAHLEEQARVSGTFLVELDGRLPASNGGAPKRLLQYALKHSEAFDYLVKAGAELSRLDPQPNRQPDKTVVECFSDTPETELTFLDILRQTFYFDIAREYWVSLIQMLAPVESSQAGPSGEGVVVVTERASLLPAGAIRLSMEEFRAPPSHPNAIAPVYQAEFGLVPGTMTLFEQLIFSQIAQDLQNRQGVIEAIARFFRTEAYERRDRFAEIFGAILRFAAVTQLKNSEDLIVKSCRALSSLEQTQRKTPSPLLESVAEQSKIAKAHNVVAVRDKVPVPVVTRFIETRLRKMEDDILQAQEVAEQAKARRAADQQGFEAQLEEKDAKILELERKLLAFSQRFPGGDREEEQASDGGDSAKPSAGSSKPGL